MGNPQLPRCGGSFGADSVRPVGVTNQEWRNRHSLHVLAQEYIDKKQVFNDFEATLSGRDKADWDQANDEVSGGYFALLHLFNNVPWVGNLRVSWGGGPYPDVARAWDPNVPPECSSRCDLPEEAATVAAGAASGCRVGWINDCWFAGKPPHSPSAAAKYKALDCAGWEENLEHAWERFKNGTSTLDRIFGASLGVFGDDRVSASELIGSIQDLNQTHQEQTEGQLTWPTGTRDKDKERNLWILLGVGTLIYAAVRR